MASPKLRSGAEIEAYCTKCRLNLNHIIISVADGEPNKVQCLTCDGEHKYRPPKSKTAKSKKKAKTPKKTKKDQAAEAAISFTEAEIDKAKEYAFNAVFKEGEILKHPKFGTGKVVSIISANRMEVIFPEGSKILVYDTSLGQAGK